MSFNEQYRRVGEIHWHIDTPEDVIRNLQDAIVHRKRVEIEYGDRESGRSWGDIECGYIGRSTGEFKIPLLVHNSRSSSGHGILSDSIVRVSYANKEVGGEIWRHPNYSPPEFVNQINR